MKPCNSLRIAQFHLRTPHRADIVRFAGRAAPFSSSPPFLQPSVLPISPLSAKLPLRVLSKPRLNGTKATAEPRLLSMSPMTIELVTLICIVGLSVLYAAFCYRTKPGNTEVKRLEFRTEAVLFLLFAIFAIFLLLLGLVKKKAF